MFERVDRTTSTNAKIAAIADYFRQAPPEDAAWALYFLTGAKLKRLVNWRQLWQWSMSRTNLQDWLLAECYNIVGDGAETISLLIEASVSQVGRAFSPPSTDLPLHQWIEARLLLLPTLDPADQQRHILEWWSQLSGTELFLFNKLVTGELRVGVSQRLVIRALAAAFNLDQATIAHRLAGDWKPTAHNFRQLLSPSTPQDTLAQQSRPYPFFLASPLLDIDPARGPETLGPRDAWLVEHKWDGIRAQLIRRAGNVWLWSRGDELITDRFPEIRDAAYRLPDQLVIDGEIMAYQRGPLKFSILQRRIGRHALTPAILRQAPAALIAFDLLEHDGADIRHLPLSDRRARLNALLTSSPAAARIILSQELPAPTWKDLAHLRAQSRQRGVEGLMIKRWSSPYQVGRRRGDWWKWKVDPFSIDAVLIYAQPGHGRRANLLTDYTFAVWDTGGDPDAGMFAEIDARRDPELVPFAKAYSGLSDAEIAELDRWIRRHTIERFGPVRAVQPAQVFELHFEAIAASPRHRSGIAVRFPRIARWRRDKQPQDADTLQRIKDLIDARPPDQHKGA
jgi:DNA ligase 1